MQPTPEQWARLLDGSHNEQDQKALQIWLAEDEANPPAWEDYQQLWHNYGERAAVLIQQNPPRSALAWQRLEKEIKSNSSTAMRRLSWQVRMVAAAVVLLITLGGWWLWQQQAYQVVAHTAMLRHQLPDGSVATLRQGSQLHYARQFNHDHRTIHLQGEAFFEVQRNEKLPFIVQTDAGTVEVIGTSFLVEAESRDSLVLSVYSGVTALSQADFPQKSTRVVAGQAAVSTAGGIAPRPFQSGRLAWKTGELRYKAAPLAEVISDLEHWYGIRIRCKNRALLSCPITIAIEDEPLEAVLATIAALFDIQLSNATEGEFLLQGGQCNR